MSLILEKGTEPQGIQVKTSGVDSMSNIVFLGEYEISLEDFFTAVHYVLINTDLKPNDIRLRFIECVRSMRKVEGYNPGQKRLEASESPIPC